MKNVLIVAGREFRQILGMRSFWLTLLILPIAFGIGPLAQRFLDKHEPDRVMIIDRTGGGEARAIEQRFTIEHNRAVLGDLSRYVQRHHLEGADRSALWAQRDRWYSSYLRLWGPVAHHRNAYFDLVLIHADPRLELPVIVVSASGRPQPDGVDAYLRKPFNLFELLDSIHQRC